MLSNDLAEWHQEAKQHWYLGTQQCHRGSHLLCKCVSVCVCVSVHPSVVSTPGTTAAVQILTHIHIEMEKEGEWVHGNKFTDCVYDESVIIKNL